MAFPKRVTLVEVGPRDGLQNEEQHLSVEDRVAMINGLVGAGLEVIESGAFVSPKYVPAMAGSGAVLANVREVHPARRFPVLVPNMKGYEAAKEAGAQEIAIFGAASETFSRKNINASIAESLARFEDVCRAAYADGIAVRGYVSCVLGCPYEGTVTPGQVLPIVQAMIDLGCQEISLGDTIGVGRPNEARALVEAVTTVLPVQRIAAHFHDTYGQALANIYAVMELGVAVIDTAVAGLGGCPYAPGASGNVATEDVVYMLDGMGIETGVSLDALVDVGWSITGKLGRTPLSRVSIARRAACTIKSVE